MANILGSLVTSTTSSSTTRSVSHTLLGGAGRAIIATITTYSADNISHTSVYYDTGGDNVAMTFVGQANVFTGGNYIRTSVWRLLETDIPNSTGIKTVTSIISLSRAHVLSVYSAQGLKQENPIYVSATGVGNVITDIITTVKGAFVHVACAQGDASNTLVANGTETLLISLSGTGHEHGIAWEISPADGSDTYGFTGDTGDDWSIVVVVFENQLGGMQVIII